METLVEDRRASTAVFVKCTWEKLERTYRCQVILCPEEEGGYSALAKRLPGVVSQGETEDEALVNIAEALRGALSVYLGEPNASIPWSDEDADIDRPVGSIERWILVDV